MSKPSRKNSPSSAESAAPATAAAATGAPFAGLDLLSSSVLVLDAGLKIRYINSAAENLLAVSSRSAVGALLGEIVEASASLHEALDQALAHNWGYTGQGVEVRRQDGVALQLNCTVNPVEACGGARLLLELLPIDQQLRATREERLLEQQPGLVIGLGCFSLALFEKHIDRFRGRHQTFRDQIGRRGL